MTQATIPDCGMFEIERRVDAVVIYDRLRDTAGENGGTERSDRNGTQRQRRERDEMEHAQVDESFDET